MTEPVSPPIGARIEVLLDEVRASADPHTLGRVEELVEQLVAVYGGGLSRIMALLRETDALTEPVRRGLADDPLVSALLVLHGLHPQEPAARVRAALDALAPALAAHGGAVTLLGIDEHGVALIRLDGRCDGCVSSEATVRGVIERAILDAAPELARVEVSSPASAGPGLVQIGLRRTGPGDGATT